MVKPDILTLSKLVCPSTSRTPLTVVLVNVAAAGVDPPMTELSIVPPFISAEVATKDPIVPKLVRDELTIPDPRVLASRTVVLFIL